jgi:RNA polymerase sigma factor (sigma-70 family)
MTMDQAILALRKDARNPRAWEILAREVHPQLLAYVSSLLMTFQVGAAETSEDFVQEALLHFYARWPLIRSNVGSAAALQAYLRKTCRNLLVDRYRQERRAESFVRFLELRFQDAFHPEAELYRGIFLKEIVQSLPAECAALIREYVESDLSPAEIAEKQNASPSAFYSRWYRCIQKARETFVQKKGA